VKQKNSIRGSAARVAKVFAYIKKANPALAEITIIELSLRTAYFDAHKKGVDAAVGKVVDGVDAALNSYERVTEPPIRAAIHAAVPNLYAAGKQLAGDRAAAKHPPVAELEKASGDEESEENDEIAALIALFFLGVPGQLRRVFLPRLRSVVETAPPKERAEVLRRELGRAQAGWSGPARRLYNDTSAYMATTTRTVAGLRELRRRGVRELRWRTAGDDRVCRRCTAMESVSISIDDAAGLVARTLAVKSLSNLKRARPWLGEVDFFGAFRPAVSSGNASKSLGAAGLLVPPLHAACRCVLM